MIQNNSNSDQGAAGADTGDRLIEDLQNNPATGSSENDFNSGVIIVLHGDQMEQTSKIEHVQDEASPDANLRRICDLHQESQEEVL